LGFDLNLGCNALKLLQDLNHVFGFRVRGIVELDEIFLL
jgi:hypothetical protein